ncbi:hypothetical protein C806_03488 [Lachnospiraceae bacterium 3-1]|nr:hypothetical protein C806_03488 [Lachnospiraceae bacterium 3-1]
MKIDRMIGILSILLQQEKVTAPYLAEKFEVSRRTINRDIVLREEFLSCTMRQRENLDGRLSRII